MFFKYGPKNFSALTPPMNPSHLADYYRLDADGVIHPVAPFYSRSALAIVAQRNTKTGAARVDIVPTGGASELARLGLTVTVHYAGDVACPKNPERHIAVYIEPGADADRIRAVYAGAIVREALRDPRLAETYLRVVALRHAWPVTTPQMAVAAPLDEGLGTVPRGDALALHDYDWRADVAVRTLQVVLRLRFSVAARQCRVMHTLGDGGWGQYKSAMRFAAPADLRLALAGAAGSLGDELGTVTALAGNPDVADAFSELLYDHQFADGDADWPLAGNPGAAGAVLVRLAPTLVLDRVAPRQTMMHFEGVDARCMHHAQVDYAMVVVLPELERGAGDVVRLVPTYTGMSLHYTDDGALSSKSCDALELGGGLCGPMLRIDAQK